MACGIVDGVWAGIGVFSDIWQMLLSVKQHVILLA
jgi:hypothetical protein